MLICLHKQKAVHGCFLSERAEGWSDTKHLAGGGWHDWPLWTRLADWHSRLSSLMAFPDWNKFCRTIWMFSSVPGNGNNHFINLLTRDPSFVTWNVSIFTYITYCWPQAVISAEIPGSVMSLQLLSAWMTVHLVIAPTYYTCRCVC